MLECLKFAENLSANGTPSFRLIRKAIREPWSLTEEQRQAVVDHVLFIVRHSQNETCRLKAVSLILEMDKVNLAYAKSWG